MANPPRENTEVAYLAVHEERAFPIAGHVLDETECVRMLHIVFRQAARLIGEQRVSRPFAIWSFRFLFVHIPS